MVSLGRGVACLYYNVFSLVRNNNCFTYICGFIDILYEEMRLLDGILNVY